MVRRRQGTTTGHGPKKEKGKTGGRPLGSPGRTTEGFKADMRTSNAGVTGMGKLERKER